MNKTIILINSNTCTKNESRVFKEATSLQNAGYRVINVAYCKDNLPNEEVICGIKTVRFTMHLNKWIFDTKPFLYLRKIVPPVRYLRGLILFEYMLKIFFYYFFKADYFHCYRVYTLPVGVLFKILSFGRKKLIYDPREYESEAMGIRGTFQKLVRLVEKVSLKFTDGVIAVSDSIAEEYARLYNIKKPSLVLNAPPFYEIKERNDLFRKAFNIPKDSIIFLYQGGLFKGRGIEDLLTVFKALTNTNKVIVFMGYGELESVIKEAANAHNNIFYHPAVPPDILLDYTSSADIGFLLLSKECLSYYYAAPNKLFEYIQAELPIIASDLFETNKIISRYKNGVIVGSSHVEIRECVEEVTFDKISAFKTNLNTLKQKYNWEEQEKVLLELYRTV